MKILSFNVYYYPNVFGGATVVADQLNKLLVDNYDVDIQTVCTIQNPNFHPYQVFKYNYNNIITWAINLPQSLTYEEIYNNQNINKVIAKVVKEFQPDILHLHSMQKLGIGFIDLIKKEGSPIIVSTYHDMWWLCERQFMINKYGYFCNQNKINHKTCLYCVREFDKFAQRQNYLARIKNKIDLHIFPSKFHRNHHILNDYPKNNSVIIKNGVKSPKFYQKNDYKDTLVRFGFTGGPGKLKGFDLIISSLHKVLEITSRFEIVAVNGAQNIGKSWVNGLNNHKFKKHIRIVPAYTQESIDGFFNSIDCLLFPTQIKESFGLTVREALIRNKWVISTKCGGVEDDLYHNQNSYILNKMNDSEQLAKYMINFIEQKPQHSLSRSIVTYNDMTAQYYKTFVKALDHE